MFELVFFPFAFEKKGLCDPTLPFVKTIGPEVYKGEISIMLVSKVTIAIEAWVFAVLPGMLVYLFPQTLPLTLMRGRGLTQRLFRKKEVFIPLSDPLRSLEPDVIGDRSEGSELTLVFACTPYLGF